MIKLDAAMKIADKLKKGGSNQAESVEVLTALDLDGDLPALLTYNETLYRKPEPEPKPATPDLKYIVTDKNGNQKLDIVKLTNDLLADFHFATYYDTDEVMVYKDGYYQLNAERFVKNECERRVGVIQLLTVHNINEIIAHIQRKTYIPRDRFNSDRTKLNLRNGVLEIASRKLLDHNPELLSTIQLPVKYDPAKDCPLIKKFMSEVLLPEDVPVIQEFFGYCLIKDNGIQKAFLLVGDGNNGKSVTLNLLKSFIGRENCANMPWQSLEYNRFAMAALEGKLANIFADLPSRSLDATTAFKMLTGGDTIGTEKKFKDAFSFVNYARLIFSANKPPMIEGDDSYAFWRRWIIVKFPYEVPPDKRDKNLIDKLITEDELSGLLNYALDGLDRLLKQGEYSYKHSVEDVTETYLKAADPIYAFCTDPVSGCEIDVSGEEPKDDVYDFYRSYSTKNKLPIMKPDSFARALKNQVNFHVRTTRPQINGKRVMAWSGLHLDREKYQKQTELVMPEAKAGMVLSSDFERCLGMTIEKAVAVWIKRGSPVIHLETGDITDLASWLRAKSERRQSDIELLYLWLGD